MYGEDSVRPSCEHMFVKVAEHTEAVRLRKELGWPINKIATELKVAKSTVSLWVRDIVLTAAQVERLRRQNPAFNAQLRGQNRRREQAREIRLKYQQEGRDKAREGDSLHAQGCMLFWAEGSRRRNCVILTNADPELLRFFLRFLRECYRVEDDRVRLSCNCFLNNGLSLAEIEAYWLTQLGLSSVSLCKTTVNRLSRASGGTKRKLPYGTARLTVHSTEIAQSIHGAIQEYGGFSRPEWLDFR